MIVTTKKNAPGLPPRDILDYHTPGASGIMVSPSVAAYGNQSSSSDIPRQAASLETSHKVLLTGIDTLAITAGGKCIPSDWLREQQVIWSEYQDTYNFGDNYICILFDNLWWELYPHGSNPYKFQLRNNEVGFIKIWNCDKWESAINGKQQIHITFYSKFLHQHNRISLLAYVRNLLNCFFDTIDNVEILASRVDLHSDITNGSNMLTYEEVSSSISRSKVRNHYFDTDTDNVVLSLDELEVLSAPSHNNKGGQKLIPEGIIDKLLQMYDNQQSYGVSQIIKKKELETAYFGKKNSDIWGKCYNKTKEIITKNDNDTPILWEQNGWDKKEVVVRVEFSMRRGFLKQLDDGNYVSLDKLLDHIDKIWVYLTENWLRLVEEVKDNNTTWSRITKFWGVVQSSYNEICNTIIRKKRYNGRIIQLWKQGIGCISQMIALGMSNNVDTMFLASTIQAVETTLSSQQDDGSYFLRRQLLGIA
jgi:hypothetical protein